MKFNLNFKNKNNFRFTTFLLIKLLLYEYHICSNDSGQTSSLLSLISNRNLNQIKTISNTKRAKNKAYFSIKVPNKLEKR